jgi:hypothetical protein
MKKTLVVLVTLFGLLAHRGARAAYVWIEGESCRKTNMEGNPWPQGDDPRRLSGEKCLAWVCGRDKAAEPPLFAIWDVTVPEDGKYVFYAREFYKNIGSPWRYRLVNKADLAAGKRPGPEEGWTEADPDGPTTDTVSLGKDRALMWVKYASHQLKKGDYILDLQLTNTSQKGSSNDYLVNFDCFVLTSEPFMPRGAMKPGEKPASTKDATGAPSYY